MKIERTFAKRETEKSVWAGEIGSAVLEVNGKKWMLDGSELPEASVEYLLNFSLQSLQDAYAGAESLVDAKAAWAKKRDALLEGTIGVRQGGGGEPTINRYIRAVIRKAITGANATAYKEIGSDDQKARNEFLWNLYEGLGDEKRARVDAAAKAAMDADIAAKKAANAASTGISI